MGSLTGKAALVTGGSRGIGRGIAERLGRDGAVVGAHYGRDEAAALKTVAAIEEAGGTAFPLGANLAAPGSAAALWTAFDKHADGVDILVNNAGTGVSQGFARIEEAEYDRLFDVNTKAPFFLTRLALDRLRDGERVINISTGLSHAAMMPDLIAYAMTKGALDVFTRYLSRCSAAGASPSTRWPRGSWTPTPPPTGCAPTTSPGRARKPCPPWGRSAPRPRSPTWWPFSPRTTAGGSRGTGSTRRAVHWPEA